MYYTLVVDGTGNVSERRLGDHDPGTVLQQSVSVASNTVRTNQNTPSSHVITCSSLIGQVEDGVRTVVMYRGLAGKTPDHYTFDPRVSSVPVISASGTGSVFSYHGPKQRSDRYFFSGLKECRNSEQLPTPGRATR